MLSNKSIETFMKQEILLDPYEYDFLEKVRKKYNFNTIEDVLHDCITDLYMSEHDREDG